jgi:A/G-specific adenine glycosylase
MAPQLPHSNAPSCAGHTLSGQQIVALRKALMLWFSTNQRRFPWRETQDAWYILLAEMLLHRTRSGQVIEPYLAAIERYPTPGALASASLSELQDVVGRVGLSWRIEAMHAVAKALSKQFGGQVPKDRSTLLSLPGIGPYIADAVRCFAYGEAEVLLDTNTVRVIGRLRGMRVTDASRRSKAFRSCMEVLYDRDRPREFNLALIDHGALVCTPRKPSCTRCPILPYCEYGGKTVGGSH